MLYTNTRTTYSNSHMQIRSHVNNVSATAKPTARTHSDVDRTSAHTNANKYETATGRPQPPPPAASSVSSSTTTTTARPARHHCRPAAGAGDRCRPAADSRRAGQVHRGADDHAGHAVRAHHLPCGARLHVPLDRVHQ